MRPEELRKEANAAEFMARLYGRDKEWLTAKAAELRHLAERQEQLSWRDAGCDGAEAAGKPARRRERR